MAIGSRPANKPKRRETVRDPGVRSSYLYGAVLLLLITIPVVWLVTRELEHYQSLRRENQVFGMLSCAFDAYDAVASERRASYALLDPPRDGMEYQRRSEALAAARQATDKQLSQLAAKWSQSELTQASAVRADLDRVRSNLARGRIAFNMLFADSARQRSPGAIRDAIEILTRATDPFDLMIHDTVFMISTYDAELIDLLTLSRLAAHFREYAGRLGAVFIEPLVTGRDLTDAEQRQAAWLEGRMDQLRDFLLARTSNLDANPRLGAALQHLKYRYVDTSLDVVTDLRSLLTSADKAPLTPTQFSDLYMPGTQAIVEVRNTAFDMAKTVWEDAFKRTLIEIVATAILGILAELVTILVVIRLRGRYVAQLSNLMSLLSEILAERPRDYGRDAVLSELTHDMKSPQAGIIALLELSRTTDTYQSNPELFFRIEGYAKRTLKMLDDFVQASQAQAPGMDFLEVDLHGAVLDAADDLYPLARSRSIDLEVAETDGEPHTVYGNPELLTRAITNVMENAIKYSPDGAHVRCELARERRWTVLSISDTGYGISAEDLPYVFERYRRFRAPGQPRIPGTGLGLAFVQELMIRMRGKVACRSQLGRGTRFELRFPLKRSWRERASRMLRKHPIGSQP